MWAITESDARWRKKIGGYGGKNVLLGEHEGQTRWAKAGSLRYARDSTMRGVCWLSEGR